MADKAEKSIAMVHYHLRRGGVTRVIEAACEALEKRGHRVLILSGEKPFDSPEADNVRVVPALKYRRTGNSVIASSFAEVLRKEARNWFGTDPDLWHFHNPTLAKNVLFPTVVRELAEEGERVLLQIHDFAEDGRPANYTYQRSFFDSQETFESTLYPTAKQIHYATINRRDYGFLKNAGLSASNLHVIPNAVSSVPISSSQSERPFAKDLAFGLYPSRGIRRKNLGELLLLAMKFDGEAFLATSLSPENPEWLAEHRRWEELVEELDLPVKLGIADSGDYCFSDLVGWSDFILTTSVGEGFGLSYLEPWTVGRGVLGRDLPEITDDFRSNGLELPDLYSRIEIPLEWVDEKQLKEELESALRRSYLAYNVRLPIGAVEQTWRAWTRRKLRKSTVDFGVLHEDFQMKILRKLRSEPECLEQIEIPPLRLPDEKQIAAANRVVQEHYSVDRYGERLVAIYDSILSGSTGKVGHLSTRRVLDQFLAPSRLNLLRD